MEFFQKYFLLIHEAVCLLQKNRNLSHLQQMIEESDIDLADLESLSLWDTYTEFWEKDKNHSSETCNNFFLHHTC